MTEDRAREILARAQQGAYQGLTPAEIAEAFEALMLVKTIQAVMPRFDEVLFGRRFSWCNYHDRDRP